jgi:hypothetical protein
LEIADPDRRKPLVVGAKWCEEKAAYDRDVRRGEIVKLHELGSAKMGMVVARLSPTFWEKTLQYGGAGFNEERVAERCGQERGDYWDERRVTSVGTREKTHAAREQGGLLGYDTGNRIENACQE